MHAIRFLPTGALIDVWGPVDADAIVMAATELASHPSFDPTLPAVWDFTPARGLGALRVPELHRIADQVASYRRPPEGMAGARVAVIVPGDVEYGVARMYEGLNADLICVRLGIFRSRPEGERWALGHEVLGEAAGSGS